MDDEFGTEQIFKIVIGVFTIILPLVSVALSGKIEYTTKLKSKSLEKLQEFFDEVLIPLITLLRDKDFFDVDQNIMRDMDEIYNNNYLLIPQHMHLKYQNLKKEFNDNENIVDSQTFKNYYKYVNSTFYNARKKLGYTGNNNYIYFSTLSIYNQIVLILILPIYIICVTSFVYLERYASVAIVIFITGFVIISLHAMGEFLIYRRMKKRKSIMEKTNKSSSKQE